MLRVVLVGLESLRWQNLLLLLFFVLAGGVGGLLFSRSLALVLKIKPNRLLEVNLDGATLVLSLKRIIHLDVDLRSVEGAVTDVVGPRLAESV